MARYLVNLLYFGTIGKVLLVLVLVLLVLAFVELVKWIGLD